MKMSKNSSSDSLVEKIYLNQVRQRTEILSTFLPNEVLDMPYRDLHDGSTHKFMGVLLMVEIVGFTTVCEKYRKTGRGGIYRLTATLNAYLGALIEVIQFFRGDILKFSGEGMLALWKSPPSLCLYEVIHEVIVCSLFIQRNIGQYETEVNVGLKLKLGISCGNLTFTVLGKEQIKAFILIGQAIYDMRKALTLCQQGEVSVGSSAWGHVSEKNYEVTFAKDGVVKIWKCLYFAYQQKLNITYHEKFLMALELCNRHLYYQNETISDDARYEGKASKNFISSLQKRPAVRDAHYKWVPSDLKPFVVKLVQNFVDSNQPIEYLTELKEVTICCVLIIPGSLRETDLMNTVTSAFTKIDHIIENVKGMFFKVNLFHKSIAIYTVFGLSGVKHEVESQNALKAAFAIKKSISSQDAESISIGVSSGLVYCGVIGHPYRKEYSLLGTTMRNAEQMMYTYEGKISCDYETYKNSKLSSIHFQLQSSDTKTEEYVFEYNEDFEKIEDIRHPFQLIGRENELEEIKEFLMAKTPEMPALCFKAQSKQGRTKLLEKAVEYAKAVTKYVSSVTLHSDLTRPCFCVSILYQHLYDILAQEKSKALLSLPRVLWDFGGVVQGSHSNRNSMVLQEVQDNLKKLVMAVPDRKTVLFVDNIEYIDNKSFEMLCYGLKHGFFKLMCTGSFGTTLATGRLMQMSRSNQFKIISLKPLQTRHILPIICSIMDIQGVSKKLLNLFEMVGHCQPGWIETSLLKLINNGELELEFVTPNHDAYIFLDNYKRPLPLVVKFSKKYFQYKDKELFTLPPITIDVFQSFTTLEKNIVTLSAVLGKVISRSILMRLLNITDDETEFSQTIYKLFKQQVFDCASKFIYSGGLKDESASCLCFMTEEELTRLKKLPKYAYCKLIYFRSRIIRTMAYELMPVYQKKETHLTITNVLEMEDHLCPSCKRDNSTAIIKLMTYSEFRRHCVSKNYTWKNRHKEEQLKTEQFKEIIRNVVSKSNKSKTPPKKVQPRRIWDPTICFCLEMLTKVYNDLIHHSERGGHEIKTIYFKMQYGLVLFLMNELDDSIKVLSEASELCQCNTELSDPDSDRAKKILFGRIHYNLGTMYYKLGNLAAAKNHASISLRQYDVPLLTFTYRLPYRLLNEMCLSRLTRTYNSENPLIKYDFGMCLTLVSNIFASEGRWEFARTAMVRSLACLRRANCNIDALCDIYSSAIDLYNFCGDSHVCEKLERCFNKDLLRYYSNGDIIELYSVAMLVGVMFRIKVMSGQLVGAVRLGFRALYFGTNIHAYYLLLEVLPILASMLVWVQRIDEAVHVGRILFNIGKKYHIDGFVAYYAFCMEIMLETNFYVETYEAIAEFAKNYLVKVENYSELDKKLIIALCRYRKRKGGVNEWATYYKWTDRRGYKFLDSMNVVRSTEMALLDYYNFVHGGGKGYTPIARHCNVCLYKLKVIASKWDLFKPRFWHYSAYYQKLKLKNQAANSLLSKARKLAIKQNNVLETNWTNLNESYWFGGISLANQIEPIDWKIAKTYNTEQCTQIMFGLPYV